jgi:outer membrane protein assembly factor BamB
MRIRLLALPLLLASVSLLPAVLLAQPPAPAGSADSWPGFRGPAGDGHAGGKNVPTAWGEKDNVRWKTAIHGKGWSSPVALGGQVWVTTSDEQLDTEPQPKKGGPPANPVKAVTLSAVCVDRADGRVVHDLKLATIDKPQYCHPFNSYASSTPYLEDGRLYAHFGALGTFCIDTKTGQKLWERLDFKCDHFRGAGSSVAVHGDVAYLIFDGADLQYVVALNKKTGETIWKTDRKIKYSTDNGDIKKAYATPALLTVNGKPSLVCPSAECTIAYDPKTGEEQWRVTHGGMNGAMRPVVANGLLYTTSGHTGRLLALKPDMLSGAVPKEAVAFQIAKDVSVRPSPLVAGDLLFMVSDGGIATCHDAKTGAVQWRERLDGEYSASPVLAGGNVYFCNQIGKTYVVKAAREYSVVAENRLADGFMASPAVAGDDLFLRTKTHLYAIGKK